MGHNGQDDGTHGKMNRIKTFKNQFTTKLNKNPQLIIAWMEEINTDR